MAEEYDLIKIRKKLKKHIDKERLRHTEGVMYTAAALAMAHGGDLNQALTAGLLHDCAKCIPDEEKLTLCAANNIPVSEYEANNPFILHAKLGAFLACEKYGVTDPDILRAIAWHTTGKENMTRLDKIIYIADYIEPGRTKAIDLPLVRRLAFQDLDETMYRILADTLSYLRTTKKEIDPTTERAYVYYVQLRQQQGGGRV